MALLPSTPATVGLGVPWGSAVRSYLRHYLEVPWSHMNAWRLGAGSCAPTFPLACWALWAAQLAVWNDSSRSEDLGLGRCDESWWCVTHSLQSWGSQLLLWVLPLSPHWRVLKTKQHRGLSAAGSLAQLLTSGLSGESWPRGGIRLGLTDPGGGSTCSDCCPQMPDHKTV